MMFCRFCWTDDGFTFIRVFETRDDESARRRSAEIARKENVASSLEEVDELNRKLRDIPRVAA
jgi:hypothetical protein